MERAILKRPAISGLLVAAMSSCSSSTSSASGRSGPPPSATFTMADANMAPTLNRDVSEDSRAHERMQSGAGFVPAHIVTGLYQAE